MRLTLLAEGPTDQALLPILRWALRQRSTQAFEQNWADLRLLHQRPIKLVGKVRAALDLYPCDLLVVHRDADKDPPDWRVQEILTATQGLPIPVVCVVPVHMTEAWLLFDEVAIRRAAGCPSGTMPLDLPSLKVVEARPDPKAILHEALRDASNLSGRRRKQFHADIRRVADLVDDFSPLRVLPSFRAMEQSLADALHRLRLLRS
jgi:hypothetical protein